MYPSISAGTVCFLSSRTTAFGTTIWSSIMTDGGSFSAASALYSGDPISTGAAGFASADFPLPAGVPEPLMLQAANPRQDSPTTDPTTQRRTMFVPSLLACVPVAGRDVVRWPPADGWGRAGRVDGGGRKKPTDDRP